MSKIPWTIRLNTVHAGLAFVLPFLVFLPFLLFFGSRRAWHKHALMFHRWWAWVFFSLLFIPIKIDWRFRPSSREQYIFCANHFSFFDIPAMGLLNVPFKFIGKVSLAKVPLFGLMYRMIHITVDRSNLMSRAQSQKNVMQAVDDGFNITYFPEGGMITTRAPQMVAFKDGAFKLAVERDLPIVPVTLRTNYMLFPDNPQLPFYRGKFEMIVHTPIFPEGHDQDALNLLRRKVRSVIEAEFN